MERNWGGGGGSELGESWERRGKSERKVHIEEDESGEGEGKKSRKGWEGGGRKFGDGRGRGERVDESKKVGSY